MTPGMPRLQSHIGRPSHERLTTCSKNNIKATQYRNKIKSTEKYEFDCILLVMLDIYMVTKKIISK